LGVNCGHNDLGWWVLPLNENQTEATISTCRSGFSREESQRLSIFKKPKPYCVIPEKTGIKLALDLS